MADPEGNDFCAFIRPTDRLSGYRLHGIGIDCRGAEAQASWWGGLFGTGPTYESEHNCWTLTGLAVRADVGELLARGATYLRDRPRWTVLADPEGNEFCVFPPAWSRRR